MIKIPLIGSDIRFDEVTIRAIKTFEYLDQAVDQIFDRIDARIEQNMTRIGDLNSRLEKASEKIERLKTSKKAIRMFSPARYPIEEPLKFRPTFDSTFQPGEVDFHYKLDLPLEKTDYKQYADKLQFFHLKTPKQEVPQQPNLIFKTTSVNSLITFVNNENLYLKDATKSKDKELPIIDQKVNNDETDFNRFSTMIRSKHHADNFHYLPSFNQAPEFEFPLDLPDLDGIADDITFSVPDEELMEPTFRGLNIVNDLPNISELMDIKKSEQATVIVEPPSIPVNLPNIPPPPPIPQNVSIAPPPPPPPMMTLPSSSAPPPPTVPQVDDARSSLMQAIRAAAGKTKGKLKTVPAADEHSGEEVKKSKPPAPALSLMEDLHEKLRRRREGIAGTKQAKKEKIMDKVSSLIPPPPKRPPSDDDSGSSDSNYNDDNDWD